MKCVVLLALLTTLAGLAVSAAADEIYVPSKSPGTSVNYFPFRASYREWRYQLITPPSPLGNQAFTVTDIAFNPKLGGGILCSLFEVRMGHTTAKVSTVFALNLPSPTTVFSTTNSGWVATAATWSPIGLQKTFNYNGTSSLVIEIRYRGGQFVGRFDGLCYNTYPALSDRVYIYGTGAFSRTSGRYETRVGLSVRINVVRGSISSSGTGRIGTMVAFNLAATGETGKPYQVGSSLGQGPIPLGSQSLPLSPDELLMLSIGSLAPAVFQNFSGKLDTKGTAVAKMLIPNIGALKGVRFYTAFLTLDTNKPLGVGFVSPKNVVITIS